MINTYDIYLISDSTGETLERIFLAIKAQFKNFKYKTHFYSFTRTENQISKILEVSQEKNNVIVLYTIVDNKLARHLSNECSSKNIPCFGILGDLIINLYFFLMSIYGWFFWSKKEKGNFQNKISRLNLNELIFGLIIFFFAFIIIWYIYNISNWEESYISSIDTLTTAIFCSAMWFMARRKIEHWTLWIVGDIISIPLYFYKGLYFTSIQYLTFTIIAILGFFFKYFL